MEIGNGGSIVRRAARGFSRTALLGLAFGVAACGPSEEPEDSLVCGPGTETKNGVCVAIVDPIASCGDGTEYDEDTGACEPTVRCADGTKANDAGECVPVATCGPGTTLDLATGRCLPVASCGAGTVLDDATGRCVSEATCGAGTDLVDGECVAVGVCATGTVLNMETGLCESHLECGPGQVVSQGSCVAPNVAVGLEADAHESVTDANDPAYGGTPEPLTLEPVGEKVVFVGNISRPTDFLGTGVLAQDRDVWAFDGVAGQYLSVSVLGTGLPQPAFVLEGPRGYERVSPLLSTQNASREVVLPYTGRYELTVVPSAYLSTGVVVGGANAGYVGVIEELEKPTPATLTPGASQDAPTEVSGNLSDLSDNFFLLQGDAGDAVSLVFQGATDAMPPSILAFDASGALVTHADVDLSFGDWVGTLVKEGGTTLVVDWQSSTTSADAFTLAAAKVPNAGTIAVAPNAKGVAPAVVVPASSVVAYTITNEAPLVVGWTTYESGALSGPDVQLLPAHGQTVLMADRSNSLVPFYAEQDGVRTVFVYNDGTSENEAIFSWEGEPVTDVGTLDAAAGDHFELSGNMLTPDLFGPRGEWMVVRFASPGVLKLTPDLALGDMELFYYSQWGVELHEHPLATQAVPAHAVVDADPVLVRLQSTSSVAALDWTLRGDALPYPAHRDLEPNDTLEQAVAVGSLPARLIGHLESTGVVDVYRLDIADPVDAGEAIQVHVENLDTDTNSTSTDAAIITILDEDGEPLPAGQLWSSSTTPQHQNRVTYYIDSTATQSSSTFYIHLQNHSSSGTAFHPEHRYLIDLSVVTGTFEVEPNNTVAEADEATAFPVTWEALWTREDDLDVFAFTLDEDVPSDKLLEVRFHGAPNGGTVKLLRADESEVLSAGSAFTQDTRASVGGLAAGRYYITVKGSVSSTYRYKVGVALIDMPPLEAEPNDDAVDAQSLGVLGSEPLFAFGDTRNSDPDWFAFTLPQPLTADESVRVRCLNVTSSTSVLCEIYDLTDAEAPVKLQTARHRNAATMVSTSATSIGVRVAGTSSSVFGYLVYVDGGSGTEVEPNDDPASAVALGELAPGGVLAASGSTISGDSDWFTFTLADDVDPNTHGIWVDFQNLLTGSMKVYLYDLTDPDNPRLLASDYDSGDTLVTAPSGAPLYGIEVLGNSTTTNHPYEVWVEIGPRAELEPNDTPETANDLGALPATLYGQQAYGLTDVFTFTLDEPLGPTELVEISFFTSGGNYNYELRLGDEVIDASTSASRDFAMVTGAGAAAGTYVVEIKGTGSPSSNINHSVFVLEARIVDTQITP